jgi:Zn-dependent M28 family amino/carboxypeptidase
MRKTTRTAIAGVVFFVIGPTLAFAESTIDASHIRAHLEFLADDLLEGRESGTRGYDIAASYVAAQFKLAGLEPAGRRGFFDPVPLRRSVLHPGSVSLQVRTGDRVRTFTDAEHFAARPSAHEAEQNVEADCVFAGYGIVAPELRHDDYAGLDVRGKLVVVLGGPAPGFPSEVAAHLTATDEQRARAAERGALGLLIVYTPALEARWPFAKLPEIYAQPQIEWIDPAVRQGSPPLRVSGLVDPTAAAALFEGAPRDFQKVMREARKRPPKGFPLRARATFSRSSRHSDTTSANVVALLPGSDPVLADEVIVFTSHLDHVGIGVPRDGDAIYNGALDNAVGIATMIEIARALKSARTPLRRSVMFVATTAEEKGLIGTDYFARNPPLPRERLVGVINLDGAMPFFDLVDVIGYGADSSTLGRSLERAAESLGITVSPDPAPEQAYFTRSDHYPFVRQGIPGVYLIAGDKPAPDAPDPAEISRQWAARHLHQPSDDLDQDRPFHDGHLEKWAQLYLRWVVETANAPERPLWYAKDFFGDRYAAGARKAVR